MGEDKRQSVNLSRYINRVEEQYTIKFTSYAVPHSGNQVELSPSAVKAQFRFWWRVLVGKEYANPKDILVAESELFGGVKDEAKPSELRIRLQTKDAKPCALSLNKDSSSLLYFGYGALSADSSSCFFPGTKIGLTISYPIDKSNLIHSILTLMNHFGFLGGRSRKGLGSYVIESETVKLPSLKSVVENYAMKDWKKVYLDFRKHDFPFCLARDEKGLLAWKFGKPVANPEDALRSFKNYYKDDSKDDNSIGGIKIRYNEPRGNSVFGSSASPRVASSVIITFVSAEEGYQLVILHLPYFLKKDDSKLMEQFHKELDLNKNCTRYKG